MCRNHKKIGLFFGLFLISGAIFSASRTNEEIASECKFLGSSLNQLAQAKMEESCSIEMNYSGDMMIQAAQLIQRNKTQLAIDNLNLVGKTLASISHNKTCPYFSTMVSPYLNKTRDLYRELESHPSIQ